MSITHYLVIMLIWLSIEALASLLAWASSHELGRRSNAAGSALLSLVRLGLLTLTVLMLGGCGGGGCDADCEKDFAPVDCQATPELCT